MTNHADTRFPPPALRRRWRVPPLPERLPVSAAEAVVLEEMAGEVGLVLRQALCDVLCWSVAPSGKRESLFRPGAERTRLGPAVVAGRHAELEGPLEALVAVVRKPGTACAEAIAIACRQISQWADERGALGTALVFAECAATAAAGNAGAAVSAGMLARRRGEPARSEAWYLRAVALARQGEDRVSYAQALQGLGFLELQRGRLEPARRRYSRAARAARACGARDPEGRALHSLFVVVAEQGNPAGAERYAQQALAAYGRGHPNLPNLAHDLAHFWLMQGLFASSLRVFEALLPHRQAPLDRLRVLADVTRAAGGTGNRERVIVAWTEAWELALVPAAEEGAAASLLDLAHGAGSVGEWPRAERAARRAAQLAEKRGQTSVLREAECLLEAIAAEQRVSVARETAVRAELRPEGDDLAAELVRTLAGWVPA